MKKELVLTTNNAGTRNLREAIASIKESAMRPIEALSRYYSRLMEEEINVHQTLLLVNAQAAAFFAIFPISFSLILRVLFIAWFATAVIQCKKSGL